MKFKPVPDPIRTTTISVCWLLCAAMASNAHATSQCYQWQQLINGQPTGWRSNPQEVAEAGAALCNASNANKATCNNVNCSIANLNAGATCTFTANPVSFSTFPNVAPPVTFRVDWVYPWGYSGTKNSNQTNINYRAHPDGCYVYVSAPPDTTAQCGPSCNSVGDPINPASGGTYATEADLSAKSGTLEFKRYYNSTDPTSSGMSAGWRHTFSRSVKAVQSGSNYRAYVAGPHNSSLYSTEAAACTNGFSQIRSQVSNWANASASYANGVCTLSLGNTTIGRLPLLYASPPTPAPGAAILIAFDAIRDDGRVVRFMVDGSAIVAPPSITLKLQQTSSGYTLTTADDAIEAYDTNGKLLSVRSRTGIVQTMGYDILGRLAAVTDSFGRALTLTYDDQGRLSAVTSQ